MRVCDDSETTIAFSPPPASHGQEIGGGYIMSTFFYVNPVPIVFLILGKLHDEVWSFVSDVVHHATSHVYRARARAGVNCEIVHRGSRFAGIHFHLLFSLNLRF